MKIEDTQEVGFKPFSITIESLDEARILLEVAGSIRGTGIGRSFCSELYDGISMRGVSTEYYFDGELRCVK